MRTVSGATGRVVVVGAGLAGLSAALRLCGAGREVTVVERCADPGGCAGRLRLGGYTFDTGPTVITMSRLIDDALRCVGERAADRLDLVRLDPVYRVFFAGGERLDVHSDTDRTAEAIAALRGPAAAAGYREFARWLADLYDVQWSRFIDSNADSPLRLVGRPLARLAALGGFRGLDAATRRFLPDDDIRRAFSFQALYVGLSPYDARALYAVIAHLDTIGGAVVPRGGVHEIPRALAAAAAAHGVRFHYATAVSRIAVDGDRATGVVTESGEQIAADAVVVTGDLPTTYRDLLPARVAPRRLRFVRVSPSCVLLHVGSRTGYPQLAHHNVLFGTAWRRTFRELIDDGRLMSDPSLLVTVASHTDPSLAPRGRHGYYVLAPVPATSNIDWARIGPRYRDELVRTLERRGYDGFGEAIEVQRLVTPADWRAAGHANGTPFAAAHTVAQTGPFRFANMVRGLENVVLAGAWTVPGVGVPMALVSGRLAAQRITG